MYGIAERLLESGDLGAEPGRISPAVGSRQQDVSGERTVAIHAQDADVLAKVVQAALALPAGVVDHMRLSGYEGPGIKPFDLGSDRNHSTGHLVAEDAGRTDMAAGPIRSIRDVYLRAAEPGSGHFHQDIAAR